MMNVITDLAPKLFELRKHRSVQLLGALLVGMLSMRAYDNAQLQLNETVVRISSESYARENARMAEQLKIEQARHADLARCEVAEKTAQERLLRCGATTEAQEGQLAKLTKALQERSATKRDSKEAAHEREQLCVRTMDAHSGRTEGAEQAEPQYNPRTYDAKQDAIHSCRVKLLHRARTAPPDARGVSEEHTVLGVKAVCSCAVS